MEFIKKIKPAFVDVLLHKYFESAATISQDTGDFTFPPSHEFILDLTSNFTMAEIEKFENGPTFSSYQVHYNIGGKKGEAIYKTTTTIYPDFVMYDSEEEYKMSF